MMMSPSIVPMIALFAAATTMCGVCVTDAPKQEVAVGSYVSVTQVFYNVDPKEVFVMMCALLALWELMKFLLSWFLIEAAKTILIDYVLRQVCGCCKKKRRVTEENQENLNHGLSVIYKMSLRNDYKVHLFPHCDRVVKTGRAPTTQQICQDCLLDLQTQIDSVVFSVVDSEVEAALKKHGGR